MAIEYRENAPFTRQRLARLRPSRHTISRQTLGCSPGTYSRWIRGRFEHYSSTIRGIPGRQLGKATGVMELGKISHRSVRPQSTGKSRINRKSGMSVSYFTSFPAFPLNSHLVKSSHAQKPRAIGKVDRSGHGCRGVSPVWPDQRFTRVARLNPGANQRETRPTIRSRCGSGLLLQVCLRAGLWTGIHREFLASSHE